MLPIIPKKTFIVKHKWTPPKGFSLVPFTVGQETILLAAKESEDQAEQYQAMIQIISECSNGTVEGDDQPVFVIEDLFLRLYEKSIGEKMSFQHRCEEDHDGVVCGHVQPLSLIHI